MSPIQNPFLVCHHDYCFHSIVLLSYQVFFFYFSKSYQGLVSFLLNWRMPFLQGMVFDEGVNHACGLLIHLDLKEFTGL